MAAGDPGSPARYYSSTAVETSLQSSIAAQSQGASNTSFIVASISGFPTSYPYTLIVDPDTSKEEVLTVTSGSSTTLTVTRGEDNTQAVAHSAGAVVRHGVSGRDFRESENHIAARGYDIDQAILTAANQTHVHGIATGDGVIVGTDKEQTLNNKTIGANGLKFEGTTTNAFDTTLNVEDPTANRTITFPNTSGTVTINDASQTLSNKTLGSNLIAATYKITGLGDPTSAQDAATKNYVDTGVSSGVVQAAASAAAAATSATSASNSATAAATSATSAAASATAAATSATSAAASATAASTSATSAAASATAAATSASSASTSASSALTSANSASTSASSAATSASSASTSASAAATSATSAAASATAANASAVAAAASAASVDATATTATELRQYAAEDSILPNLPARVPVAEGLLRQAAYWVDATNNAYIPTTASGYMYLPGVAGNNATTPDAAALDITGDIDLRVKVALDNWIPSVQSVLIAKSNLTTSQASYFMSVNTDGTLNITWYANGSTAISKNSTVITGVANGAVKWVRATLDVDNGSAGNDVKFYLSDDGSTWTQLGDTVTTASTTSIFNSTAVLSIGMTTASGGTTALARGKFYRAQVLNGIGGTTVFDANFETAMTSQTVASFTESSTNSATVTINRTTYNFQLDTLGNLGWTGDLLPTTLGSSTAADSNDPKFLDWTGTNYVYLPGSTSDRLSIPDAANLDVTDLDVRVRIAFDNADGASGIASRTGADPNRAWLFDAVAGAAGLGNRLRLQWYPTGSLASAIAAGGTATQATGFISGRTYWVRATLDVDNGSGAYEVKFYKADDSVTVPTSWTQVGTTITGGATTNLPNVTQTFDVSNGAAAIGKVFRAQLMDGIDGTTIADVDTSVITSGAATSFYALSGQTVTINRSTSGRKTVAVVHPVWLFGTDDYMEVNNRYMSSGTYLYLPGVSGNTATSPDAAALDITGDIDIRAKIAMDDWTPSASNALIAKYGTAGQRSYYLALGSSTGLLQLNWSADGTNVITKNSTVAPTITDGSTLWVRVTLDVDNGASGNTVTFYTSTDGTTWTQLGDAVVTAGTTSIHSGTSILEIGTWGAGSAIARGKFFRAQVLNGIDGTVAFDANFESSITSLNQASFTESSANSATVTINRSGSAFRSAGITQAGYLYPGGTNTFRASAVDYLNHGLNSFSFGLVYRQWNTPTSSSRILFKGTSSGPRYQVINSGTTLAAVTSLSDGLVANTRTSAAPTAGTLNKLVAVVDREGSTFTNYFNNVATSAAITVGTGSADNFLTFVIGQASGGSTAYADMELVAAYVFRRALTEGEIASISTYYAGRVGA